MTRVPAPAGVKLSFALRSEPREIDGVLVPGRWIAWVPGLESFYVEHETEADARRLVGCLLVLSYGRGVAARGKVC